MDFPPAIVETCASRVVEQDVLKKGKWVFVPLENWESKPDSYYCFRKSSIYLQLVFKVSDDDLRFCLRHNLLPPERLRGKQAELWIDGARRGVERARIERAGWLISKA